MKLKLLFLMMLLALGSTVAQSQTTITGKVTDAQGEPLTGATVKVEGTSNGVTTNVDGVFSIKAKEKQKLTVSYIGFYPRTETVTGKPMNIVLDAEAKDINEVVVVGYGTQKKSDITTAITSVNVAELAKSGSAEVLQALQGKVSGVQIMTSDGSVNSNMQFRIRGVNSITGGTQPLFVIDGVPMPVESVGSATSDANTVNNPLMGLNPNDIASIEVLKDASAAAIYGAKGSNGVVLITTKHGIESTKPKFSVGITTGLDYMQNPKLQVLSPEEYAYKMRKYGTYDTPNLIAFWDNIIANKGWTDANVHNWLDEIVQTAHKNDINASMEGGTKGMTYMLSAGYLNNSGVIRRSRFDRFTSRLNLTQQLGLHGSMGLNASFSTSQDHNPTSDWSQSGIVLNALQRSPFLYYPGFADIMNYSNINIMSPLVAVDQVDIKNKYDELNANLWFSYNILKGLTFTTSASYRRYTVNSTRVWGSDTWFGQSEQGRMELGNRVENSWVWEARMQYNKQIGAHSFSVMGGFETSKWWSNYLYTKATNFEDMLQGIYGINKGLVTYAPSYLYDSNKMVSWIGRATYNYQEKYLLTTSLRVDGSSKFGKNNRYGYFPAVSAAWRASEEEFIKNIGFISNLRFRASFGMTGNNQIPSYQSLSQLSDSKVVFDQNTVEIGRYPSNVTNDDLKWESQKQFNVGFDFAVWRNRLQLTADFYYKRIDDMLLQVNIPSTSGFTTAWKNAGVLENKGMEFHVTAHWFKRPVAWSTDFNISFYRNKILSLDGDQYEQFYSRGLNSKITSDVLLRVGQPVGVYYGYISDGVYNNSNEVTNGYSGSNLKAGEMRVVDVNHDGIIDSNDRVPIANVNPAHTGGIGNTLEWKNFDLYAFFRWSVGNDVINGNAYYLQGATNINNIMKSINNNIWYATDPDKNFPLSGSGTWSEGIMRSDLVEDGSFLRLQTVSLGYNFPKNVLKKLNLSKMRLSVTGTNLWLLTRYSGFDPEANTGTGTVSRIAPGLDMSPYPRPRSVAFSLEVGL